MLRITNKRCSTDGFSKTTVIWISAICIIFIIIVPTILYAKGFENGRYQHFSQTSFIDPIIDGNIETDVWRYSDLYNYPQYSIFNSSIDNADSGWNYLSVGQNQYYLYIALDLTSILGDLEDEKMGFYLILPKTNDKAQGRYFDTTYEYNTFKQWGEGWGVDALVYDFENDTIAIDDPLNTIPEASVEISYRTTLNSNNIHRVVEIAIPIEDIRYYEPEGLLGIMIQGNYGINGTYGFASISPETEFVYYRSSAYIGVMMGQQRDILI